MAARPPSSPPGDPRRRAPASRRDAWRDRSARVGQVTTDARQRVAGATREVLSPVGKGMAAFRAWADRHRRWFIPLAGAVGVGIAAILPFLNSWFTIPEWLQRATSGSALARVGLFALFALGLNVVVGFAGLLDLGYVAFWAIGSYTAGLLTGAGTFSKGLNASPPTVTFADKPTWQAWMWLIIIAALIVAVFAGVLLGSPTLRLRGDYLAIVTLGIASIPHPEIHLAGKDIVWGTFTDNKFYWLFLSFVVLWIVAIRMLDRSRIGRAWVAIREDEVAAAAMGIPVLRMKLAAFAIGACTAGVGGVIYAEQVNFINPPTFALIQSILILSMVVIGGMGSTAGAILGAALVTLLPEIFRGLADYRFFLFGLALIVVMIFRPQGLLPSKRRKAELKGGVRDEGLFDVSHDEATT